MKNIAKILFSLAAFFVVTSAMAQNYAPIDGVVHQQVPGTYAACANGVGQCFTPYSVNNPLPVAPSPYASAQTFVSASATGANTAIAPSLPAVAGKTNYLTSFTVTADGATTGLAGSVTLTGVLGGTQTFIFTWPAGVTVNAAPITIAFPWPLPASAANTAITLNVPAGGAGNTLTVATLTGFTQ
jgi:hypothetical protein